MSAKYYTGGRGTIGIIFTLANMRMRGAVNMCFHTGRDASTLTKAGGGLDTLHKLDRLGINVESHTYVKALQRCMEMKNLAMGKQVHDHIIQSGRQPNMYVVNTLIKMYTLCGSVADARQVFNTLLEKTVVSWNAMISGYAQLGHVREAFTLFCQMQGEGLEPNTITYSSILNACSSRAALEWGKEVHAHAIEAGFVSDVRVGTALVKMYVNCGSMKAAQQVFDQLVKRDVTSWNVLIRGYAKSGDGGKAFEVFHQMRREGSEPNAITYTSILDAFSSPEALAWGREVHAQAMKAGLVADVRVATAFVNMYAKCGRITDARRVFDAMVVRDVISWTVMIAGYSQSGRFEEVFALFHQMQQGGLVPDRITYIHILDACASPAALERGKEVHAQAIKAGFEIDVLVGTALVNMYAKCGSVKDARQVFDRMVKRDVISWTAMIGGYAKNARGKEAFEVFHWMQGEGVKPDSITYMTILNACDSPSTLELGREVHAQALKAGFGSHVRLGNALVNMYAKRGSITDARRVFDDMVRRDVVSWNAMIGGYAQHGCGREALQVFEQMMKEGLSPNAVTFVGVLSACSHAGLVEEGRRHFASLSRDYNILPTMELYGCMVDLLGRAGHLDEAENLIKSLPLEVNTSIWGALLGACRIHGNVMVAERAAASSLKIDAHDGAVYVLLSHIYAAAGMWDNVAKVRKVMKGRGVKKEQGRSWIEVEMKVHWFVAEDRTHPRAEEIYAELKRLMKEMKSAGYTPDTQLVMHDVDEQQKEEAICHHSEKLAIAYGLISTPPGRPIHIFKNLRVCADCHTATKFISKISGREIVARDSSRFHHFKDGVCSCGDYW